MHDCKVDYRYDDSEGDERPHVIRVLVPHKRAEVVADEITAELLSYGKAKGLILLTEDVWSWECGLLNYVNRHFHTWLKANAGIEDEDWSWYTMDEDGLWCFIDFSSKDKAMLFKLTFDNN